MAELEELRETNANLQCLIQAIPDAVYFKDTLGHNLLVNKAFAELVGMDQKEITGKTDEELLPPDLAEKCRASNGEVLKKGTLIRVEEQSNGDGSRKTYFETVKVPIYDDRGNITGLVGVSRDITERKRVEELQRIQRDLGIALGSTSDLNEVLELSLEAAFRVEEIDCGGIYTVDSRTEGLDLVSHRGFFTDFAEKVSHYGAESVQARLVMAGKPLYGVYNEVFSKVAEAHRSEGLRAFAIIPVQYEREVVAVLNLASHTHDEIPVNVRSVLESIASRIGGVIARVKAETAQRDSEEKYRSLIEKSNDAIFLLFNGKFVVTNYKCREMFRLTTEETEAQDFNLMDFVAPQSRNLIKKYAVLLERKGIDLPRRFEFFALTKNEEKFEVEASLTRISYRNGTALQGILRDVSEKKLLEAQLLQSQKMEAVGRLAGGVAHDFNNLLTAILGHCDLGRMSLDPDDPLYLNIEEIYKAAERASSLTRQLLAFSRKQTLEPKIVDLNIIITEMEKMLRRIIGENIDLATIQGDDLYKIKVDPGQIEQVIVNLIVNAYDAIPNVGKITIETGNMELDEDFVCSHPGSTPGSFAVLSVSDTGIGMTEEVAAHIFEPFYTTKGEGKGTGLGLSTVYGIVKQSSGYINVDSEIGKGTTIKIYFPSVEGEVEVITGMMWSMEAPRGFETILVVEDEEVVRELTVSLLDRQGYKVMEANSGADAYQMCRKMEKQVDLVITDVVMPAMSGDELVELLCKMWPTIKVLYMSGYTENAIVEKGILGMEMPYMQKPFRAITLARKVREILDG